MKRKIVYIYHPISNNYKENVIKIRDILRELSIKGEVVPFAHYLLEFEYLDDTNQDERSIGMGNNQEFFYQKLIDEIWVYGEYISNGMEEEIRLAMELGIPVKFKTKETLRLSKFLF